MTSNDAFPVHISTAIMTHPSRLDAAKALRDQLPELTPTIVVDPDPAGSSLRTAQLAWFAADANATHHLVLQDDVTPCHGFTSYVYAAVKQRPDAAIALCTNWGARTANVVRVAALAGARWTDIVDFYVPSLALVLPADVARSFGQANVPGAIADDEALAKHLGDTPPIAHIPHLVQHDHAWLPSLVGNGRKGPRRATCFSFDPAQLAADRDETVNLHLVPHFSWSRGHNHWLARTHVKSRSWYEVSDLEVLTHHGLSVDDLERAHHERVLVRVGADALAPAKPWLWDLWLTAVAYGLLAATYPAASTSTAVAHAALASLPAGGLRLLLSQDALEQCQTALTGMVIAAAQFGIDAVRSGTAHGIGARPLPRQLLGHRHILGPAQLPESMNGAS